MRGYWIRIGVGAVLIFGLGYAAYATGSRWVKEIKSSENITIPLGAFGAYLPFKLEGTQLGTLRSFTIQRESPGVVTGFRVRARVEDTAAFERIRNCRLTVSNMEQVSDLDRIDERNAFVCLASDSGYQALGEVRVELRTGSDSRTIIQPLIFPSEFVAEFRRRMAERSLGRTSADSIAREIRSRVRTSVRPPAP